MFDILEADIVIMQEAKIQRKDLQDDMVLVPGWDVYFSLPQHKKGKSRFLKQHAPLTRQGTLALPSTPKMRRALRFAQKKVSSAFCVRRKAARHIGIYQKISRLADTQP